MARQWRSEDDFRRLKLWRAVRAKLVVSNDLLAATHFAQNGAIYLVVNEFTARKQSMSAAKRFQHCTGVGLDETNYQDDNQSSNIPDFVHHYIFRPCRFSI